MYDGLAALVSGFGKNARALHRGALVPLALLLLLTSWLPWLCVVAAGVSAGSNDDAVAGAALVVALLAHAGLIAALTLAPPGKSILSPPERMTVTFADETADQSASPDPNAEAAPDIAPVLGEPAPEPAPPEPTPVVPPQPRPAPQPVPQPKPQPAPRPAPKPVPQPSKSTTCLGSKTSIDDLRD
jgi:outer membrane biosynthesis protein TonB